MSVSTRAIEYYTTTVPGTPESAYQLLGQLARHGVNLLAFNAIPVGLQATQLVLFPEPSEPLLVIAREQGLFLGGPDRALYVQGGDEMGALARVHDQLAVERVQPYASSGLTDGHGGFGYIVYVRQDQFDAAARALGL
jgi:hypothetical protein